MMSFGASRKAEQRHKVVCQPCCILSENTTSLCGIIQYYVPPQTLFYSLSWSFGFGFSSTGWRLVRRHPSPLRLDLRCWAKESGSCSWTLRCAGIRDLVTLIGRASINACWTRTLVSREEESVLNMWLWRDDDEHTISAGQSLTLMDPVDRKASTTSLVGDDVLDGLKSFCWQTLGSNTNGAQQPVNAVLRNNGW